MNSYPVVVILSGKRKSGKDYVAELLMKKIGVENCAVLRLSGPLKEQYAKEHNLNFSRLLDSSDYKEKFRDDMIRWGEEKRNKDPSYFCRLATSVKEAKNNSVWIISDARRPTDIEYFKTVYSDTNFTCRILCDESVRKERGFVYTDGIDNADSECALDHVINWDFIINNNGDSKLLNEKLTEIVQHVTNKVKVKLLQ